jgi:hypothetical protein
VEPSRRPPLLWRIILVLVPTSIALLVAWRVTRTQAVHAAAWVTFWAWVVLTLYATRHEPGTIRTLNAAMRERAAWRRRSAQGSPRVVREMSANQTSAATATLQITRGTRGGDRLRAYHVIVDGDDVGVIRRGRTATIALTPGQHQVHLTVDWCRSPSVTVDVASGQVVSLSCWSNVNPWEVGRALQQSNEWIGLARSEDV